MGPDTGDIQAQQNAQRADATARQATLDNQEAAKRRALLNPNRGRGALIGPAGETGVQPTAADPKQTLGA